MAHFDVICKLLLKKCIETCTIALISYTSSCQGWFRKTWPQLSIRWVNTLEIVVVCKISVDTYHRELFSLKVIALATSTRFGMKRIYIKRVISICRSFSVQWCELAYTQREQWYMPLHVKRLETVINPPPSPLSKLLSTPKTLPPTHVSNCSFFRSYVFLVLLILLIKYIKCKIQKDFLQITHDGGASNYLLASGVSQNSLSELQS